MNAVVTTLRITEVFYSLQGESTSVGVPTVFVRLTGCPLRCHYCDTAYAFQGGKRIPLNELIEQINAFKCKTICITGGEPLAQPACFQLLTRLCDQNFAVSLETSGALPIEQVDARVMVVMDLKTPDSGECDKNLYTNLEHIKPSDNIKFVICSELDYQWACQMIETYHLIERTQVLFSPCWGQLNPTLLADWIVRDRLAVRFQLQLHKLLWHDVPGH